MANPFAGSNGIGFGFATSSAGTSSGIGLDPTARVTMIQLDLSTLATSTGAGTCDITIQGTLDVMTSTWSGTSSATVVWNNISTSHYSSASAPSGSSAGAANTLVGMLTLSSPVAGLRLSSTTWAGGNGSAVLKVLQEIIA